MKALLIVDLQNDFCPGGALPAPDGDRVVPVINSIMDKFDIVVASRDWHPEGTVHFDKWPVHCIENTPGADFHPDLERDKISLQVFKGTGDRDDGYSAFEATSHDFDSVLRENGVREVYVSGLTTEYCVKSTAADSMKKGYKTYLITDAVEGIRQNPGDVREALNEMTGMGIQMIRSDQII